MLLLTPLIPTALGGCIEPSRGLIEFKRGEGEDREDKAPFVDVCTAGSEGRFSFWCGGTGLFAVIVAITKWTWVDPVTVLPRIYISRCPK